MKSSREDRIAIAIPVAGGRLCPHFGHCEQFVFYEVDIANRQIIGSRRSNPPPHEPGVFPRWLHDEGANVVIAGGMGKRAQGLFAQHDVRVVVGAPATPPDELVADYLNNQLTTTENPCDH